MAFNEQRQARDRVRELHLDPKLGFKIIAGAEGVENLTDEQLKEFEYALLISVINKGLGSYLDKAKPSPVRDKQLPFEIADRIGVAIATEVSAGFKNYPHAQTIMLLAEERSKRLSQIHPQLGQNVYPLGQMINDSSLSGSHSTYASAVGVASVIKASGFYNGRPRTEFIDAIKRSAQFPVARTLAAFRWHPVINDELHALYEANMQDGQAVNSNALVFDPDKEVARLAVPIEEWRLSRHKNATISYLQPEEERVGCPVSFDARQVRRFYEHMVEVIEHHQAWPDDLLDPDTRLLSKDMLYALGLIPTQNTNK